MPNKSIHYAWIVAAVTFLVLLIGAGIRATPGVLILPLQQEFGWSNAQISGAIAINILLYGLVGPFAVALMERFGLRATVCAALGLLSVGVGLTIFMTAPWQLTLLWGLVVGLGSGMVAMVLGATVAERWFVQRRGLILGLLTASSATGQLVFLPLLAQLVAWQGWRAVSLTVALLALLLVPLVALLLRDRPVDLGLPPYGGDALVPAVNKHRNPVARALRALGTGFLSRDFWLLGGSFFICGASTNGLIGTHLITACGDYNIPEVRAAGLLAMMGVFDFFGTTGSGWLTDRFDSRLLLFWYYALRGLSLLYLPFAFDGSFYGLSIFAVFYGLDWIATVPPTIRLAEQSFGRENAAVMFGWIAALHQVGGAFAAWVAGTLRTQTGSYFSAFLSAGLMCFLAAILVAFIGSGRALPDAKRSRRLMPETGSLAENG
ncbi:MFS transporter [Beijerinckia indica]|uniref:Major facilitator superfamily MFS_1 n=1 Tax=Beijerinckia indica subsp. indica (strain ATCC 9039 / DSM 1715 / NCIMB 8712) TaxID=395963 RepID=B2IJK2_BEII9|nr:MFS transporter [Beijerinckia indica]ACB94876.1 major facilitator superfamily MFS_1 [Beijerinckia indica subsp. indica ATCC 9039]